ncbi:MAG: FAD:protein FMN transferase [Treponema sp.]|jgi:thiamine biosynthesis lipoprotein|nr:FAD:protein FMN transferase [Treponema sp.]
MLHKVLFACLLAVCGCLPAGAAEAEAILGTICEINLYERDRAQYQDLYRRIFRRIREIEQMMSANLADTELDKVNQAAGIAPVRVSAELLDTVEQALRYAGLSGGAFDPTIGPLVKLWGIGSEHPQTPSPQAVRQALSLVNWRDAVIDRRAGTLFLRRAGMALDLGAIAKGYAADEAARLIRQEGLPRAIIDLGGNIFAYGEKEGRLPWRIGVQDPLTPRGSYIGVLEVRGKTVVTSGVYERFFEADGRRYHHLLSTKTGYPAESGLLAVTVIADRSIDADALSTAAFVLGYREGRALVESVSGAGAVFVFEDRTIRLTAAAVPLFRLSGKGYRLVSD